MTSRAQRQVFVALQADPGTGEAVDTALRATCTLRPMVNKVHPEEDIGSFAPARHYVGQVQPDGSLIMDGTYEQCVILLAMALGEITATGVGDPYTWTWALPDVTGDLVDFALWSLEYTDGDDQIIRAIDVFAKSLTISGEAGAGWTFEAELDGGAVTIPATVTASPVIASVTPIKMAETTLYVDALYSDIGEILSEELISFTWKLENFRHSKQFAGSLYPNGRGYGQYKMTLELVMEVAAAEAHTFSDAVLATTQFAVQIKGYAGTDDNIVVNGMYMVEEISTLDERDNNNTIKITLLGEKDASDNTGGVVVLCETAAL